MTDDQRADQDIASQLFGSIDLPAQAGPYLPSEEEVARLKEKPILGAIYTFCTECGTSAPVNEEGLKALCQMAGLADPSPESKYFLVDGCPICNIGFGNPQLKS